MIQRVKCHPSTRPRQTMKHPTIDIQKIKQELKDLKVKRSIQNTNTLDNRINDLQKTVDAFEYGILT